MVSTRPAASDPIARRALASLSLSAFPFIKAPYVRFRPFHPSIISIDRFRLHLRPGPKGRDPPPRLPGGKLTPLLIHEIQEIHGPPSGASALCELACPEPAEGVPL